MNPLALSWLRRIALGLPLAGVSVLSACTSPGPCPSSTELFEASAEQLAGLGDGTRDCRDVCDELQRATGRPDMGYFAGTECGEVETDGGLLLECNYYVGCGGRPPAGLLASRGAVARDLLGAHLAEAARMELASVPAFVELARELAYHGAPRGLIAAARRSARDEVRHAIAMRRLARAAGATPAPVTRVGTAPRTARELLEDNAITGCVGESHAALVAAHQAAHAATPALRAVFSEIARDEARHALLSFAIHGWALERLPTRAARKLDERRREARDELARAAAADADPILSRTLGVPDADRAMTLAEALA